MKYHTSKSHCTEYQLGCDSCIHENSSQRTTQLDRALCVAMETLRLTDSL